MTVPAVLVMVPGALLYETVYAVAHGDAIGAVGTLAHLLITAALPIGVTLARMLTDRRWKFEWSGNRFGGTKSRG